MLVSPKFQALEFFAGGGLARLGLAAQFETIWANDIDPVKAATLTSNFGDAGFELGDVHTLNAQHIPKADLAWASFPCQDLSLAGGRAGLGAKRSGAFYGFVDIIQSLQRRERAPKILVIENVTGLLTSHNGQDFVALMQALDDLGYQAGALEIDARHFVPHSRPRVFIVACFKTVLIPDALRMALTHISPFRTTAIERAWHKLPMSLKDKTIWWALPVPPKPNQSLLELIDATDQNWWSQAKTEVLINSVSPKHREKLAEVQASGKAQIGAIYRRTRRVNGVARPFAEIRFDGLAGCLRTPSGGSSRQFLLFVDGREVRARALNAREAMRLMGVPDSYILPKSALAGLKIAGDGVAVPVVAWLSAHLVGPLARQTSSSCQL